MKTLLEKTSGTKTELLANLLSVAKAAKFHDDLDAADYVNENLKKYGYSPEFKIITYHYYNPEGTVTAIRKQALRMIIESNSLYPVHTDAMIQKMVDIYDSLEY